MTQLIAIVGAIAGFIAAGIGLFGPVTAESRAQTRRRGFIFLGVGILNTVMAVLMGRGVI